MLHSGYEVEHFPYTLSSLLQVNYYDDYNFTTDTQLAFGLEKIGKVQYDSLYINHEASLISAQGRLTGTKIKVLDDERYLTSALYYDYKGRIIQGRSQNHLGGYDTDFYSYTYKLIRTIAGKPLPPCALARFASCIWMCRNLSGYCAV